MMRCIKSAALLLLLLSVQQGYGQASAKETAALQVKQAILLEERGKTDDAISLIQKAQKLDPGNIEYPYELAYAYNLKKDQNKVIAILENLRSRKDAFGKIYQLLGNTYDDLGKQDTAIAIYKAGLRSFPHSGELYLELGNIFLKKKAYESAALHFERGIEMDPAFPSNYYRLTKMFFNSTEKIWGMIYGEIFLLLEPNSKRTAEISKLLYDTYKSQVKMGADSTFTVHFSNMPLPETGTGKDSLAAKPSFERSVYEPVLLFCLKNERSIDINSLSRIRKNFIEYYFKTDSWQKYPNVLFDYQYRALKAGHIEAYNHWVLSEGDHDDFIKWQGANKEKYAKFINWFLANPIKLDEKYKFYRAQY